MFIRIRVFNQTDYHKSESKYDLYPFAYDSDFTVRGDSNSATTQLITLNTEHIVSVYPVYYHFDDEHTTYRNLLDGFLVKDTNDNTYLSPVPNLDLRLMELNTQKFDMFTFEPSNGTNKK